MGRPPKSDESRRDEMIRIRVTIAEKREIEIAAEQAGLDVSAWVRTLAVKAAQKAARATGAAPAEKPVTPPPASDTEGREE